MTKKNQLFLPTNASDRNWNVKVVMFWFDEKEFIPAWEHRCTRDHNITHWNLIHATATVYQRHNANRDRLVSSSKSWGVSEHTMRYISLVYVVLQLWLVSGWVLIKWRSLSVNLWAHSDLIRKNITCDYSISELVQ